MPAELPPAAVRAEVALPVRLADGGVVTGRLSSFTRLVDGKEHVALRLDGSARPPLVRLHSECLTGDVLGSRRCDCGPQLDEALTRISAAGGYLLYLRQEGRGIGLYDKLDAYVLQDLGLDTYDANLALGHDADARDYTVAAQMLVALGVGRIALLSNNPDKAEQLQRFGIDVAERQPTTVHANADNARYLRAKATRGGHTLATGGTAANLARP